MTCTVVDNRMMLNSLHLLLVDAVCGCTIVIEMTIRLRSLLRMHWWRLAMDLPRLTFTHRSLLHQRRHMFHLVHWYT